MCHQLSFQMRPISTLSKKFPIFQNQDHGTFFRNFLHCAMLSSRIFFAFCKTFFANQYCVLGLSLNFKRGRGRRLPRIWSEMSWEFAASMIFLLLWFIWRNENECDMNNLKCSQKLIHFKYQFFLLRGGMTVQFSPKSTSLFCRSSKINGQKQRDSVVGTWTSDGMRLFEEPKRFYIQFSELWFTSLRLGKGAGRGLSKVRLSEECNKDNFLTCVASE